MSRLSLGLAACAVLVCSTTVVSAKGPDLVYEPPLRRFTLILANDGIGTSYITATGVRSRTLSGSFDCAGAAPSSATVADVVIEFHVAAPEKRVELVPPRAILAGDRHLLTIALHPRAAGACGPWSIEVRAFVVLNGKEELESKPITLTSREMEERLRPHRTPDELHSALAHRDPGVRRRAVADLKTSGLARADIVQILRATLRKESDDLRLEALGVAGALRLPELEEAIIEALGVARSDDLARAACDALGALGSSVAAPTLVEVLERTDVSVYDAAGRALELLYDPVSMAAVREALSRNVAGLSSGASKERRARTLELVRLAIAFRDASSSALIAQALRSPATHPDAARYLARLLDGALAVGHPRDPFLETVRPALEAYRGRR